MRPGAPWIGVLLLLILVNPAAWATSNDHAVGKIEFEPPALVRGGNMSLMGGPGTYWAVYDVNASTVAEIDFKGTLEAGEVIAYDQEFIRTPPEDGYTSVPQTARLSRAAVEADSISFRLLAPLRNFSLVVNGLRGGAAQTGSGQFAAPVLNPYLLTAARHPAALQPEYGPYGWGPNFLELVAPGAYHHFKTSSMNATVNGTVAVWVGHSIVELTNSSGTRRFVLESRATPVAGPGPGAPETAVHYRGEMMWLRLSGEFRFRVEARHVHWLDTGPALFRVERLSAPLADGRFVVGEDRVELQRRAHLDVVGDFSMTLEPPGDRGRSGGGDPRMSASISGRVDGIVANRAEAIWWDYTSALAAGAGLGVALLLWALVSWLRRGAVWLASQWIAFHVVTLHPLASRIPNAKVLEHPIRRAIFEIVSSSNAFDRLSVVQREASRRLGVSALNVYYHLRKLHGAGLIEAIRRPGMRTVALAPNHRGLPDPFEGVAKSFLRHPTARAIALAVVRLEGGSQREIAAEVRRSGGEQGPLKNRSGISNVAVHKWLRQFESLSVDGDQKAENSNGNVPGRGTNLSLDTPRLVVSKRDGRRVRYWATAWLTRSLS